MNAKTDQEGPQGAVSLIRTARYHLGRAAVSLLLARGTGHTERHRAQAAELAEQAAARATVPERADVDSLIAEGRALTELIDGPAERIPEPVAGQHEDGAWHNTSDLMGQTRRGAAGRLVVHLQHRGATRETVWRAGLKRDNGETTWACRYYRTAEEARARAEQMDRA